jgi:phosphoribosylformylglycinamidine cyclo-ligase/phosphoribosylamine--glycine ligase/phosphoribosylformylglycinamidine cyclo-ligase
LGIPLADSLLAPHRSYLPILWPVVHEDAAPIKALAHLTGGGFFENIPRVLPEDVGAVVRPGAWPVPPVFGLIQRLGDISTEEMHRVFNLGIGMVAVCAREAAPALQNRLGEETFVVGELVAGERKVTLR